MNTTISTAEKPDPGHVIKGMILDTMKMFFLAYGHEADTIHLTPEMETMLNPHFVDLRGGGSLLGMTIVPDAAHFQLVRAGVE